MFVNALRVSKRRSGILRVAEYQNDTGRLRIIEEGTVIDERYPPHSWFAIASISNRSVWGTDPVEADLMRLLDQY